MSERPYDPACDASIPFYDRTPQDRALRATLVKFVDSVGTHLICPRTACKRQGGCADRDMRALPFCWEQYRGMLRFLLCVVERRSRTGAPSTAAEDEVRMPEPFRGRPLLAEWAAAGAPIGDLARSVADGRDDWDWEAIPEMVELYARLTDTPVPTYSRAGAPEAE